MKLKLQTRRLCLALAAAAVLAGGWLAIQAAPKPQAADTPAVQTAASAAAPVRTIGYTLVPLPQTDEKEAVAPADDPAAEEAPEEAPAPEEAVAPEDDAAGDPNAVPDDLELLDTFLATAYCQTGTTATGTYTTVGRTLAVNPGVNPTAHMCGCIWRTGRSSATITPRTPAATCSSTRTLSTSTWARITTPASSGA